MVWRKRKKRVSAGFAVKQGHDDTPLGSAQNLSESGILVKTDQRPPIGSVHKINFSWGHASCVLDARVVRHAENGIAFAFVKPDDFATRLLDEVVEAHDDESTIQAAEDQATREQASALVDSATAAVEAGDIQAAMQLLLELKDKLDGPGSTGEGSL